MSRTITALGIIRYDDKLGRCGKLLGLITFTDGKSLKVWDADLHKKCIALAKLPTSVRYQMRHSAKWGDALESIESDLSDAEIYDRARGLDEQRGRVKANSYLGNHLARHRQAEAVETPTPLAEVSQANALPPGQVADDYESLMRREG